MINILNGIFDRKTFEKNLRALRLNIELIRLVKCFWKYKKLWIFALLMGLIVFRILDEFSNKLKAQILLNLEEILGKHNSTVWVWGILMFILIQQPLRH